MTSDGGFLEPRRSSLPARPSSNEPLLSRLFSLGTKAGRLRIEEQRRFEELNKLQNRSTAMTRQTGETLDDMRTGSVWFDAVVDDAMAQTAVARSAVNADFMRRSTR